MSENKKLSDSLPKLGRRRLIKGAVGAAPLLITLASRPAWGGNICWSGIQSGNVSGQRNEECVGGRTPGYYKVNVLPHGGDPGWPTYDPLQGISIDHGCNQVHTNGTIKKPCKTLFSDPNATDVPGTKLGELFYSAPSNLRDYTLMQILHQYEPTFAFHAVATYFNALNFTDFIFRPDQALAIINDIFAMGYHTDSRGTIWTEEQMKDMFDSSNNAR
ncbi:MAG TPA: hypothetical protein VLA26_02715 [Gammaproteobacteria bacterium]|nr:hypothetical protein [Gammaproteobacteria bacterium]